MLCLVLAIFLCTVWLKDIAQETTVAHNFIGITMIQWEKLGKKRDAKTDANHEPPKKEFYAYENYKQLVEQLPATKAIMFPYLLMNTPDKLRVFLESLSGVLLTGGSESFYEDVK